MIKKIRVIMGKELILWEHCQFYILFNNIQSRSFSIKSLPKFFFLIKRANLTRLDYMLKIRPYISYCPLRYFVLTKTLHCAIIKFCNVIVSKLCIYLVKLSKKWMKFCVWDNFHSIPLNMTASVSKSNTNCFAVLTSKYKPSVSIQPSQARAALLTSGLYFSVQNNQQLVLYKYQNH